MFFVFCNYYTIDHNAIPMPFLWYAYCSSAVYPTYPTYPTLPLVSCPFITVVHIIPVRPTLDLFVVRHVSWLSNLWTNHIILHIGIWHGFRLCKIMANHYNLPRPTLNSLHTTTLGSYY